MCLGSCLGILCPFFKVINSLHCLESHWFLRLLATVDQSRIGPYEYSEAMQLAPEDWRKTGMPNEFLGQLEIPEEQSPLRTTKT